MAKMKVGQSGPNAKRRAHGHGAKTLFASVLKQEIEAVCPIYQTMPR